jgi:hypothetical protein
VSPDNIVMTGVIIPANDVAVGNRLGNKDGNRFHSLALGEVSEPTAPAANGVVIYAKDAAGKTTLCARFPSGVAQCFATEP